MNWAAVTRIVIVIAVVAVSLYDILAVSRGGVDATVSRILLGVASDHPIVPFAFGALFGHLFFPQPEPKQ